MSVKKFILSCLTVAAAFSVSAQETENVYVPNWYVQGQFGGQHTIGEIAFTDLNSFNAQLGVGYNFNEFWGTRLTINGWKSKAGWETTNKLTGNTLYESWSWNYISPVVDVTANLANLILGYNPDRLVNFGVFAGLGANIAFRNDEAVAVNNKIVSEFNFTDRKALRNLWDGSKAFFTGRVGANVDFRISSNWAAGLEVQANVLNDKYNSKLASTPDWYINALVGVKYTIGTSNKKQVVAAVVPNKVVEDKAANNDEINALKDRIAELENENAECKAARESAKVAVVESIRRDIFFTIRSNQISTEEMVKVKEIVEFMKKYPNTTVEVTGYADKGTGNATLNAKYAQNRADAVVKALVADGISESRIKADSKGDTVQPYAEEVLNRVAICIVK